MIIFHVNEWIVNNKQRQREREEEIRREQVTDTHTQTHIYKRERASGGKILIFTFILFQALWLDGNVNEYKTTQLT